MWCLLAASLGACLGWVVCACCTIAKQADAKQEPIDDSYILYDFELGLDEHQMKELIVRINSNGYQLVSISQDGDLYNVYFARVLHG